MKNDTIIAPATPQGRSAIACIRISGPQTEAILKAMFRPAGKTMPGREHPRRQVYGFLYDKAGNLIDEVMAVFFPAPRSYTREDMAEVYCHGNPLLVDRIIQSALETGLCRPAERGEFTFRAFINGRVDLAQAQAVMTLISANSRLALEVGLSQLMGDLSREMASIREALMGHLSSLEVEINFPEDVELDEGAIVEDLKAGIRAVTSRLSRMLEGARSFSKVEEGIKVAIVGAPNVGKSSLFNALLGRERSIVYDLHGTTRDVVSEVRRIGDVNVVLMDTAGLMESAQGVDRLAVERSRMAIEEAWVVVMVLDASRGVSEQEIALFKELTRSFKKVIVAVNKIDLASSVDLPPFEGYDVVRVCAKDGRGVETLEEKIYTAIKELLSVEDLVILRRTQMELVESALSHLKKVEEYIQAGESVELLAEELRLAISDLDRVLGRELDADLLERMFSDFCIGK